MPPFRDDQILIVAPGSQTTLAQLGLPESFTPARFRFRSCMFQAQVRGQYEPVKIRRKEKSTSALKDGPIKNSEHSRSEPDWEEDRISEEGATWPIHRGSISDWPCFYALMEHVYNTINPPFHTPILLVGPPAWSHKEYEKVCQFFFEKFKTPGLAIMDAAMATQYAYGIPTATIVDVGLEKADITCIADFVLQASGRSIAVPDCGGEAMTSRLEQLLSGRKGFTHDMCEQLKKSSICEILLAGSETPNSDANPDAVINPAAAASTGADGITPGQRKHSVAGELPRGPGPGTEVGEEKKQDDEDGVLDIASIVTGGNMGEYLAQKEREKQEKAVAKQQRKPGDKQQDANKPARLPNSKRSRNTFIYEDFALHNAMKKAGMSSQAMADMQSSIGEGSTKRQKTPEPQSAASDKPADAGLEQEGTTTATPIGGFKREIEVGTERFQAVSGGILDRLADAIYRTIESCDETSKRGELWENMIILGNGSKIRGFKDALLTTLQAKYVISPSSATIFTSELPSNLSTPMATGANTPQPQLPGQLHPSSGVNPLLHAALTAQNPQLQPSTSALGQMPHQHVHSSHGQTPTSIKLAKIPDYFPEWKEVGHDEAAFLGAQVASKLLFIVDGGASKGYMTRTDYNEQGPSGIHDICM